MNSSKYKDDYLFTMSDAHRRPAHHLGMPALTRHVAFWQPKIISDADWIAEIEKMTLNIFDRVCDMAASIGREGSNDEIPRPIITNLREHPTETTGPHDLLRSSYHKLKGSPDWTPLQKADNADILSRYETVQIDFLWHSMPVTLRVEVFEEYFTLTSFISFWRNPKKTRRSDYIFRDSDKDFVTVRQTLEEVARDVSKRCNQERTEPLVRQERRETIETFRETRNTNLLFSDLWKRLDESIVVDACSSKLGEIFADFRGLILQCDLKNLPPNTLPTTIAMPCRAVEQSHTLAALGLPLGSDAEVLHWVEALLPVLLSLESDITLRNNPADTIEYTFSTTGHGRCIFGTGFGHQAPHQRHPTKNNSEDRQGKPISFAVLASHDDHREIGRLINRLHTMGTLRLASLQFLAQLISVEPKIEALRQSLVDVNASLSHLAKAPEDGHTRRDVDKAAEEASINAALGLIRDGVVALDTEIDGGISNRALRAVYYLERFQALVDAMNFQRVAGYQPYHQFVKHRLDRAFGKIAEIGARRDELVAKERTLRNQYMIYLSENHQFTIRKIQYWAEFAFLLIVLPHYGSELMVAALALHEHNILLELPWFGMRQITAQLVAIAWMAACTTWGVLHYYHDATVFIKNNAPAFLQFLGAIALAVILVLVAG